MAMLNIPRSVSDPSYRYKMPRILTQKESRGRGSKTGILNLGDVAQAIQRDPVYLIKFFGYELGAQTTYTNKKGEGERAVVNGHHETLVFQNLVDKFIDKYVLCGSCTLPEIDMVVNKRGLVASMCKACGWHGELDNQHKLAAHISKNPPRAGVGFDGEKEEKTKEERQREWVKKPHKTNGNEYDEIASYRSEDGKEEQKRKQDKKDKKHTKLEKAQKTQMGEDSETASYRSDDGKEQQMEKEKKRKKEKTDKKAKKSKNKDQEGDSDQDSNEEDQELAFDSKVLTRLVSDVAAFVQSKRDTLTVETFYEEVRVQQVTKAFDHKLRMYVVVSALFPDGTLDAKGAAIRSKFFKAFITNGALSFADWVWGFEAYLAAHPTVAKTWPMTLKVLYDEDLVGEDEILEHYQGKNRGSPGFELSRDAVAPFIEWLRTTPDEDSD